MNASTMTRIIDQCFRMESHASRLYTSLAHNADSQELTERLREIPSVIQVSETDHQVILLAQEAESVLPAAITTANTLGVRVRSVDIQEPNLEAVFLHLTGRALRD